MTKSLNDFWWKPNERNWSSFTFNEVFITWTNQYFVHFKRIHSLARSMTEKMQCRIKCRVKKFFVQYLVMIILRSANHVSSADCKLLKRHWDDKSWKFNAAFARANDSFDEFKWSQHKTLRLPRERSGKFDRWPKMNQTSEEFYQRNSRREQSIFYYILTTFFVSLVR